MNYTLDVPEAINREDTDDRNRQVILRWSYHYEMMMMTMIQLRRFLMMDILMLVLLYEAD